MIFKKAILFTVLFPFLVYSSCNRSENLQDSTKLKKIKEDNALLVNFDVIHTAQNSLDWEGVYQGVTPCADCEGIFTTLVIQSIKTDTVAYYYELRQQYLGKSEVYFYEKGSFTWQGNGSKIELNANAKNDKTKGSSNSPRFYKVVENAVVMLNYKGDEIKNSSFAEKYRLQKIVDAKNFPAFTDIDLSDDYGSTYQISALKWVQDNKNELHILELNLEEGFLLAQNDMQNMYDPGKFTRIEWVDLPESQLPYQWAFCMISYNEASLAAARNKLSTNKDSLLNGCNGFPFTRLKITE